MELKDFMHEFEGLTDAKEIRAAQIKSHNLPVIIFGAAAFAKIVTDSLRSFGIEVSGYAVDAEYFKPNQTYLGKPVYNFSELREQPDKYVFVLGVGNKVKDGERAREFQRDEKIIGSIFELERMAYIDRAYVTENAAGFFETYNLLEDDLSRRIMVAYLKSHVGTDDSYIKEFCAPDQYFNELTSNAINGGGVRGLRRIRRRFDRKVCQVQRRQVQQNLGH